MNIEIKDSLVLASKIVLCIVTIVLVYFLGIHARRDIPIFEIKDIYIKSTANAIHTDNNMDKNWNLNIYQTNDIFIKFGHIDNMSTIDENDKLLKQVYIDNIQILNPPQLGGEISVYTISKDSTKLFEYTDEYLVQDSINYRVLPNNANIYNLEVNNISGQLALSFVNSNILSHTYNNIEELTFDGTLLKNAGIGLEQVKFKVSFNVTYVTETDKEYIYNIVLDLPYGNILEQGTVITEDRSNIQITNLENKLEE